MFTGFLAGEEGLEPPLTVLETAALPLYYSPNYYFLVKKAGDNWTAEMYYSMIFRALSSLIWQLLIEVFIVFYLPIRELSFLQKVV